MREVCVAVLNSQEKKLIDGEGRIVEIDESLFSKRKNNSGRVLPPPMGVWWYLQSNECFLVIVKP